ncbi:hypothetical protein [Arthrobacter sp. FW306-2-2C-D06B]|uniref:hypothetical protein n=1 Tax=Arthrobacter sp. FW306-2-2C-D06B TaxID=2879618 RepID=UPI001F28D159|nr:hypothetical protein [Arthrobacter sp. FW306-2-2C-D06B]UKA58040.1 hypothetical protein LFT47_17425 [Arthrobacter sp. FW306-2-2C-D06B]
MKAVRMGWTTGPDRKPLTLRRSRSTADAAQTPALGRVAAVLAAAAVLVFAPGIAQAAFNGSDSASLPVSSATLASTATVSASCSGSNLTISVTNWALSDTRFVGQFTVTSSLGILLFSGNSNQSGGGTYTAKIIPHLGTWNWSVSNQYSIPGTSNVWTGTAKTGQFTCT